MIMFRFMRSPIGIVIGVTAILIASPKARAGIRKMAVKTISAFPGKEEEVWDATSELKEQLPRARGAVRKAAVKMTVPILGIVETVQDTITKFQNKYVSDVNTPPSEQEIDYKSSSGSSHYKTKD